MRQTRGLSIRRLARAAGIHPSTLSRWETGATRPSIHELDAVMNALGATSAERRRALELIDAPRALSRLHALQPTPAGWNTKPQMPLPGDLLRAMRQRRGWNLEQTARQMNISAATLSRWEHSESWPSEPQLHHLCYLLHAHPQELIALSAGRLQFHTQILPFPSRQEELEQLLHRIVHGELILDRSLGDLFFLSLERHLWGLSQRSEVGRRLLIDAYVCHCRQLLLDARILDAQTPAARALHLIGDWENPKPHWLWVAHTMAKGAVESRKHLAPSEGVQILKDWLPLCAAISQEYEAWFLRDLAEYMSLTRATRAALEASEDAIRKGLETGDDRNVWLSHAEVLLNTGRYYRAFETLEQQLGLDWDENSVLMQKVREADIIARTFQGIGHIQEAEFWMTRLQALIIEHNLWQVSHRMRDHLNSNPQRCTLNMIKE